MKQTLKNIKHSLVIVTLIAGATVASSGIVVAQRLERPPTRNMEGTPVLPAGTGVIPAGTFLIVEMGDRLDSKTSQVSDRFTARIATPVIDANGRELIPPDLIVEGQVIGVQPARWRRRSGSIAVTFDRVRLPNGNTFPISGALTAATEKDQKLINEEGGVKGKSSVVETVFIVGGSSGAGAAIGAAAGGALIGAGVGAAAGLTTAMLIKGKEAVVEPGRRFGIELLQPLRLSSSSASSNSSSRGGGGGGNRSPGRGGNYSGSSGSSGLIGGPVDIADVRAERDLNGLLRILITASTPTTGWRIFTNYEGSGEDLEVRVRGVPPSGSAARQRSHPTSPIITITDGKRIRRVNVQGKNGVSNIALNAAAGSFNGSRLNPSPDQSYFPPPAARPKPKPQPPVTPPDDVSPSDPNTPIGSDGGSKPVTSSQASTVVNQIEQIRFNFAASVGVWINKDGSYDVIGSRQPTAEERRFMDTLGSLQSSVRMLDANASNPTARRSSAAKVQEDAQAVDQNWRRVQMSQELNQQVKQMLSNVQALANSASR